MPKTNITWNGIPVIITSVFPPIPTRQFDYCAYLDGQEEAGASYGLSSHIALAELIEDTYNKLLDELPEEKLSDRCFMCGDETYGYVEPTQEHPAVCYLHCLDHDIVYIDMDRRHACKYCGMDAPPDYFDSY